MCPTASAAKISGPDSSKIMKKWWSDQRKSRTEAQHEKLEAEHERSEAQQLLQRERESNNPLMGLLLSCTTKCNELKTQNEHLKKELLSCKANLLKANGMLPQIRKETEKVSMLKMNASVVLLILSIIMC